MKDREAKRRQRQKRRQSYGCCLEDRGITTKTRQRYFSAVRPLLKRMEETSCLEDEVAQWVEEQYQEGAPITTVSDALCGLQRYSRGMKNRLGRAWRLFKIWRRIERPQQAPPFPFPVFLGLLGCALQFENLQMAACLCLGFWGMLRTGEILLLTKGQLLLGHSDLVVQLGLTKTGLRRAIDENVQITDGIAHMVIKTFLSADFGGRADRVWSGTAKEFRDEFDRLLRFLKLPLSFRPYSLRRGGATHDFRAHGLMEKTLLKGRWSSTSAARVYVQEGLSALTKLQISQEAADRISTFLPLFQWALCKHFAQTGIVERGSDDPGHMAQELRFSNSEFVDEWDMEAESCHMDSWQMPLPSSLKASFS